MPKRRGLERAHVFHVYNRGADRQDIFTGDGDHVYFEHLLAMIVQLTGVKIHAYALMSNHFHLIIEAEGSALSTAMYHLGKGYATRYNRVSGRTGPLCDGRFQAVPITGPDDLMIEGRYVHRNPIDIVDTAALTRYRFSSLPVYAGARSAPVWLETSMLLEPFLGDREAYVRFVEQPHCSDSQYNGARPPHRPVTLTQLEATI